MLWRHLRKVQVAADRSNIDHSIGHPGRYNRACRLQMVATVDLEEGTDLMLWRHLRRVPVAWHQAGIDLTYSPAMIENWWGGGKQLDGQEKRLIDSGQGRIFVKRRGRRCKERKVNALPFCVWILGLGLRRYRCIVADI